MGSRAFQTYLCSPLRQGQRQACECSYRKHVQKHVRKHVDDHKPLKEQVKERCHILRKDALIPDLEPRLKNLNKQARKLKDLPKLMKLAGKRNTVEQILKGDGE